MNKKKINIFTEIFNPVLDFKKINPYITHMVFDLNKIGKNHDLIVGLAQLALERGLERELLLRHLCVNTHVQGGIMSIDQILPIAAKVGINRRTAFMLLRSMINANWVSRVKPGVYHFRSLKRIALENDISITRVVDIPFDTLFHEHKLRDPNGRRVTHLTIWKGFLTSVLVTKLLNSSYTKKRKNSTFVSQRDKARHKTNPDTGSQRAIEKCKISSVMFDFALNKGFVSTIALAKILGIHQRQASRLLQYASRTGLISMQQNYDKRFDVAAEAYAKQMPQEVNEYHVADNGLSLAKAITVHGEDSEFDSNRLCFDPIVFRVRLNYIPVCTSNIVIRRRRVSFSL